MRRLLRWTRCGGCGAWVPHGTLGRHRRDAHARPPIPTPENHIDEEAGALKGARVLFDP